MSRSLQTGAAPAFRNGDDIMRLPVTNKLRNFCSGSSPKASSSIHGQFTIHACQINKVATRKIIYYSRSLRRDALVDFYKNQNNQVSSDGRGKSKCIRADTNPVP